MSPLCHKRTPEPVSFDYRVGPKRPVMQRPSLLEVGRTTRRRRRCFHAILNLRCSDSGMGFVFVATGEPPTPSVATISLLRLIATPPANARTLVIDVSAALPDPMAA